MSNETTITVVGNLTADPDLKFFDSGRKVANFTVASTPRFFDKTTGQWKDGDALFMRCNLWGEYAEHAVESLTKGMAVMATGRLKQRAYETREGEKRTTVELDVDDLGPTLRFATAKVTKTYRGNGQTSGAQVQRTTAPAEADPWANAGASTAPATGWGAGYSDEPPF